MFDVAKRKHLEINCNKMYLLLRVNYYICNNNQQIIQVYAHTRPYI